MERDRGDRVEVTLEAFPQGKPLNRRRLKHEFQERVVHLYVQRTMVL